MPTVCPEVRPKPLARSSHHVNPRYAGVRGLASPLLRSSAWTKPLGNNSEIRLLSLHGGPAATESKPLSPPALLAGLSAGGIFTCGEAGFFGSQGRTLTKLSPGRLDIVCT